MAEPLPPAHTTDRHHRTALNMQKSSISSNGKFGIDCFSREVRFSDMNQSESLAAAALLAQIHEAINGKYGASLVRESVSAYSDFIGAVHLRVALEDRKRNWLRRILGL